MIVSITGGAGFIGKRLVQSLLEAGHQLRVLSRKKRDTVEGIEYYVGDLSKDDTDYSAFLENVDVLFHCAGEVSNQDLMYKLHVDGTRQLLKQAKNKKVGRWVQLSSVGAYGACRNGLITETSPENPKGIYEKTKTLADESVRDSGIPYVILRPSIVFASDMPNQSLNQLLSMIRKGIFFYIGRSGALVNYVHVNDVVNALILCGQNSRAINNTYNISQTLEIEGMVHALLGGDGRNKKFLHFPEGMLRGAVKLLEKLPHFPLNLSRIDALTGNCKYSSSKIKKELGFEFKLSLEERFQSFAQSK